MTDSARPLTWVVFQSEPLPTLADEPPPGHQHRIWPPISSVLVCGEKDAVLIDAPITTTQAKVLADQVAATGKRLTSIYVTHGHGDHWFGVSVLLDRFPDARAVAIPAVVEQMRQHLAPDELQLWNRRFPGQIPHQLTVAEELTDHVIELEGRELVAIPIGHTDTDDTTCLHVPSTGLVAAGDAVYNDVYIQLRESNPATRQEWIAALDRIESLLPRAVVAGHKRPGRGDDPRNIEETRQYIRVFDRVLEVTDTAEEVFEAMTKEYPDRVYSGALWASARGLKR